MAYLVGMGSGDEENGSMTGHLPGAPGMDLAEEEIS